MTRAGTHRTAYCSPRRPRQDRPCRVAAHRGRPRKELEGEECGEPHADQASRHPEPAEIGPEIAPPLAPLGEVRRGRLEDRALAREQDPLAADDDRHRPQGARHAEALVAQPVRERGVDDAAGARVGGEGGEQEPVRVGGEGRGAEQRAHEACRDARPGGPRHEHERDRQEEGHRPPHHDQLCALDPALDALAEQDDSDRAQEDQVAERQDHRVILCARHAPEAERGEGRAGGERPAGPGHLDQVQQRVAPSPEPGPRGGPHEAREDGLARGERVAGHLGIEHGLQDDRHRAEPEQGRAVRHGDRGAQEPVPRAERDAEQEGPRPDHAHGIAERERRRMRQIAPPPGGQRAHARAGRRRHRNRAIQATGMLGQSQGAGAAAAQLIASIAAPPSAAIQRSPPIRRSIAARPVASRASAAAAAAESRRTSTMLPVRAAVVAW